MVRKVAYPQPLLTLGGVVRVGTEAVSKVPADLWTCPLWGGQLPLQATFRFDGGGTVGNCTLGGC